MPLQPASLSRLQLVMLALVISTVAHTGPWNTSTAASTHSRIYGNLVDVTAAGGPMTGIPSVPGDLVSLTTDITAPIKYDPAYQYACTAIPAGTYTGIALVQRGGCTFDVKMTNVYNAGATAVIVFNNAGGPPTVMGFTLTYIPGVMITMEDGLELAALITGDATATATIQRDNFPDRQSRLGRYHGGLQLTWSQPA